MTTVTKTTTTITTITTMAKVTQTVVQRVHLNTNVGNHPRVKRVGVNDKVEKRNHVSVSLL